MSLQECIRDAKPNHCSNIDGKCVFHLLSLFRSSSSLPPLPTWSIFMVIVLPRFHRFSYGKLVLHSMQKESYSFLTKTYFTIASNLMQKYNKRWWFTLLKSMPFVCTPSCFPGHIWRSSQWVLVRLFSCCPPSHPSSTMSFFFISLNCDDHLFKISLDHAHHTRTQFIILHQVFSSNLMQLIVNVAVKSILIKLCTIGWFQL